VEYIEESGFSRTGLKSSGIPSPVVAFFNASFVNIWYWRQHLDLSVSEDQNLVGID
jgi:hypothetical protein